MDLFEKSLTWSDSRYIAIALTDKSYRKTTNNHSLEFNSDLATLGDAVIKLCFVDLLFGQAERLSVEKAKYESDNFLVSKVAKHYDLLEHKANGEYLFKFDREDKQIPQNYDYAGDKHKYIATAVEAVIGAIYLDKNKDRTEITELLKEWMKWKD